MGSKLLGVMTGVALLASVGVANAKGPVMMTDAQLDRVVAGVSTAITIAEAVGVDFSSTGQLHAENTTPTVGIAFAIITASNITNVGNAPHVATIEAIAAAP